MFPPAEFARAAVLVPLVDRPDGLTVLLTQRASHLKNHAGQVSFPGGRMEPHDDGPWDAALRETQRGDRSRAALRRRSPDICPTTW